MAAYGEIRLTVDTLMAREAHALTLYALESQIGAGERGRP
jgi:hypothetical protein